MNRLDEGAAFHIDLRSFQDIHMNCPDAWVALMNAPSYTHFSARA